MSVDIPLRNAPGVFTKVDEDVAQTVSKYKWRLTNNGYVSRTQGKHQIYLHRLVMGVSRGAYRYQVVDHQDGDKLNNTKENLRIVIQKFNTWNRGKKNGSATSKYKGVYFERDKPRRKPWRAGIYFEGKRIFLGCYETEREAGLAYDRAALETYGKYARLNFGERIMEGDIMGDK